MAKDAAAKRLEELLDERVHLLIRINLIENGKLAEVGLMALLRRRLEATEREIDDQRRELPTSSRSHAFAAVAVSRWS
jgi:hypothetical protein